MHWSPSNGSLDFQSLLPLYRKGELTPSAVVAALYDRVDAARDEAIWITRVPRAEALEQARKLEQSDKAHALPLFGIPFAVKDNIDVAGMTTTAGCPAFAYTAKKTADAVARLQAAGAILIGKTNLDQFATGLVGVRSPYGACHSALDPKRVSGGSSSGSAVAVAKGLVSFSLGTDTAGSGRVPAAFNNIVGLKPSHGLISGSGMVPACRSLDHISVFALTVPDAVDVLRNAAGYDATDPYSDPAAAQTLARTKAGPAEAFRFGVLAAKEMNFFGDERAEAAYQAALQLLTDIGGKPVEIDYAPFKEAAALLYAGPWLAERFGGLRDFFKKHPHDVLAVTRDVIQGGARFTGADVFDALHRRDELQRQIEPVFQAVELLALPTTGFHPTLAEVEADPFQLNANLGYYTQFANLLGCCVAAVPAKLRSDGLPFGLSLIGPPVRESWLYGLAARFQHKTGGRLGATKHVIPALVTDRADNATGRVRLAVVGAHLRGLPLNHELVERGATFVRACKTAPMYRLFALPATTPPKPGMVRAPNGGAAIEVEVWELPVPHFGDIVSRVPSPLSIGTVVLEDKETVKGFLCEAWAVEKAEEITKLGGWKNYLSK